MTGITYEKKVVDEKGYYPIVDWRKEDNKKVRLILNQIYDACKRLNPDFDYRINITSDDSQYMAEKGDRYYKIEIITMCGTLQSEYTVLLPKLINGNLYQLNGSYYVPLLFLETNPIDKIQKKNKEKLVCSIIPSIKMNFDFKTSKVNFGRKKLDFSVFLYMLFGVEGKEGDEEFCEKMIEHGFLRKDYKSLNYDKCLKEISSALMFEETSYFIKKEMSFAEFVDDIIFIPYYKNLFKYLYGVDNFKDIIKLVFQYKIDDFTPNMSDLNNRRVVLIEYLIYPFFEKFLDTIRALNNSKSNTVKLPTANMNLLLTGGFKDLMHRGNLFNAANPKISPAVHSVSQDIVSIKNKVPKSWTANDTSAFAKICPVSVSPQKMGSKLIFTSHTKLDIYGNFKM